MELEWRLSILLSIERPNFSYQRIRSGVSYNYMYRTHLFSPAMVHGKDKQEGKPITGFFPVYSSDADCLGTGK